jgi:hypothetical protein
MESSFLLETSEETEFFSPRFIFFSFSEHRGCNELGSMRQQEEEDDDDDAGTAPMLSDCERSLQLAALWLLEERKLGGG